MDPSLIESHTGMKVLTNEEYADLTSKLEESRSKIREANSKVQNKYNEVLKASIDVNNIKSELEELKKLAAESAEGK